MFGTRTQLASVQDPCEDFEAVELRLQRKNVKIFLRTSAISGSTPVTRYYYQVESSSAWARAGPAGGISFRTSSGRATYFKLFKCKDNDQRAYNGLRSKNTWIRISARPSEPNVRYEVQFLDDSGDWWFPDQIFPRKPRATSPALLNTPQGSPNSSANRSRPPSATSTISSLAPIDHLVNQLTPSPIEARVSFPIKVEHPSPSIEDTSSSILIDICSDLSEGSVSPNSTPLVNMASSRPNQHVTFNDAQIRLMRDLLVQNPSGPQNTTSIQDPGVSETVDPVALSRQTDLTANVINDPRITQMSSIIVKIKDLEDAILHGVLCREAGRHTFRISARPIQSPSLDRFNHDVAAKLNHILTDCARHGSEIILKAQVEAYEGLLRERDNLADGWVRSDADNRAISALIARRKPLAKPPPVPVEDPDAPTPYYLPPSVTSNRITVNPVIAAQGNTRRRIPGSRSRSNTRSDHRRYGRPTRSSSRPRSPDRILSPEELEAARIRNLARIRAANAGCIRGYNPPGRG